MHKSRFAPPPQPSPGDAVKLAMLADLGVNRRDRMFEAEAHQVTDREKRVAKLRARGEADDRQAARDRGVAAGDDMAVALSAWNTASNFEADPLALHSEDIAGGQAHRERLRADRESGRLRDFDEPRRGCHYGEERAAYVQSRKASDAYIAVGGAPTGRRDTHREIDSTTPRTGSRLQSAPIPTNSASGRAAPPRPPGHTRASSPRAAGTVRFGANGRRVEIPASRSPGNAPAPGPARPVASAPRATASSSNTARRPAPSPRPTQAPAVKSSAPRPTASSSNAPARPAAPPATSNGRPQARSAQSQPQQPFENNLSTPEDHIVRNLLQMRSYWCAAVPDERENFLASHPEAAKYLRDGRRGLINEITALVKRGSENEMDAYVKGHPERQWMVEAAKQAKTMALKTPDAQAAAYYANNTERKDFWQTAKELYTSERAELASTSSPASSATRPAGTDLVSATSAANHSIGIVNPAPFPIQVSSSGDQTAPMGQQACGATNGTVPQADERISSASSNCSMRSTDTSVTIPPQRGGTLDVTLVDVNGNFHNEQVKVEAAVNASFTVNSMVAGYDMRGCLDSLKVWAEAALGGRQAGQVEMVDVAHGLQGAVQRDDGIWEEDDEEL